MTPGHILSVIPQSGRDGRSSRSEAADTTAWALDTRRSSAIAPELSRAAVGDAMAKDRGRFDRRSVDPAGRDRRNPFNVYPDSVPAPLGVFLTAMAVGVLIAGNAVAACVLIGVL